jgi:hypothetical protein
MSRHGSLAKAAGNSTAVPVKAAGKQSSRKAAASKKGEDDDDDKDSDVGDKKDSKLDSK